MGQLGEIWWNLGPELKKIGKRNLESCYTQKEIMDSIQEKVASE